MSLMTGNVIDSLTVKSSSSTIIPSLLSNSTIETMVNDTSSLDSSYAITIATTLAFMVGIIQVFTFDK